jgi:hypothetical protein
MARVVLTDAIVKVGGVDLSDHIASVTYESSVDEVETTAFGQTGRTRVGGLKDESVSLSFHTDWAAASVDATISPLVGGTASIYLAAAGTAISATNPKYTGNVLITSWGWGGAVGELATVDVTWPVDGVLTRGTTA